MRIDTKTAMLLDKVACAVNSCRFIPHDPVQFPRRYPHLQDAEIVALLTATIAWGRRSLILRDAERMLVKLGSSPYRYVLCGDFRTLGQDNVHRTFFEQDLRYYLLGLKRIYERHESLNAFFLHKGCAHAWDVAEALASELLVANGHSNAKCLPVHIQTSALKRINLVLRWMVRRDAIVDLGLWDFITPAQLYIPIDVHVATTARSLGLLKRCSIDRKAAEQLTALLRQLRPSDPVYYDFALFGLGVDNVGQ